MENVCFQNQELTKFIVAMTGFFAEIENTEEIYRFNFLFFLQKINYCGAR